MISTKNLVFDVRDVPREWVFEYYLNLGEKLTGQDVKMNSVFASRDNIPSMFVYYDVESCSYKYKDFSSGYQGDHINLVKRLLNFEKAGQAIGKIMQDYGDYLVDHKYKSIPEIKPHGKFKVSDHSMRHWTDLDGKYWTPFGISSKQLEKYNITPLSYYEMTKEDENGKIHTIHIKSNHLYGYFRADGMLYKIYQPKVISKKFIKVRDYTQGDEQLTYDCKYLVITSSLKDLLSFNALGIGNIESVAPDSENTMLPKVKIEEYLKKYDKVLVMFDNDTPGINAMIKYHDKHGTNQVLLEMEKDLSDSVKKCGIDTVRERLLPLIKKAIYENRSKEIPWN
jgi:hypothetical protein